MRHGTRGIAAAAGLTAALAGGSTAAIAATASPTPGAQAKLASATAKPGGPKPGAAKAADSRAASAKSAARAAPSPAAMRQARDAMTAAVARELHVSTARASAALQPIFAAGYADPASAVFAAAAPSLRASTPQPATPLNQAHGRPGAGRRRHPPSRAY